MSETLSLKGQCYCGAISIQSTAAPIVVAYCHCSDCRRLSGAPVSAFAAFAPDDIEITPAWPEMRSHTSGVERWFCPDCGSPLAAKYDYLPDQVYLPVGLFDNAETLQPRLHSHAGSALSWLHISDDLPRNEATARDSLAKTAPE